MQGACEPDRTLLSDGKNMSIPRLVISGLSGGSGKTILSLGVARAFSRRGLKVKAFKKGPDYIDAAWLAKAAKAPQGNLDPFFCPGERLCDVFFEGSRNYDLALIEGNRGLFDGLDISGSCSTSEVARILKAPVLLILDCTKMTRTAAALVKGCLSFEENLTIGGVILNRTGNDRHRNIVRKAVEELTGVPVLGLLPRVTEGLIHERHMGLAGIDEHGQSEALLDALADFIEQHTDLERIFSLAQESSKLRSMKKIPPLQSLEVSDVPPVPKPVPSPCIGYIYDAAFWFYYQENLSALEKAGARLISLSVLTQESWPEIDGLYIGGGLPELHLQQLTKNKKIRHHIAEMASGGLPIYAECGGFMYLSQAIIHRNKQYPMANVFPVSVSLHSKPQGLGYVEAKVVGENPYHPIGTFLRGHEFHFSAVNHENKETHMDKGQSSLALLLSRGKGMQISQQNRYYDGLVYKNTFASYTHIYAPSAPHWAPTFISLCNHGAKPN